MPKKKGSKSSSPTDHPIDPFDQYYQQAHAWERRELQKSHSIDLLSSKQNGGALDASGHDANKANKASIKGMWKKAFKSLKTDSKGNPKEKEEKLDRQDSKYSRMSRQSSLRRFLSRSESKDFDTPSSPTEKTSRQSSLKRVLKRKDSKEKDSGTPSDTEAGLGTHYEEPVDPDDMDPVFATLRAASSMRRPNRSSSEHSNSEYPEADYPDYQDEDFESFTQMPQPSPSSHDFPR